MKLKQKEMTKAEAIKKMEAFKVLNSVLVQGNAEFINSLRNILLKKEEDLSKLEEKLKKEEGTEQDNAEYLFQKGYAQCLKDILSSKKE